MLGGMLWWRGGYRQSQHVQRSCGHGKHKTFGGTAEGRPVSLECKVKVERNVREDLRGHGRKLSRALKVVPGFWYLSSGQVEIREKF